MKIKFIVVVEYIIVYVLKGLGFVWKWSFDIKNGEMNYIDLRMKGYCEKL